MEIGEDDRILIDGNKELKEENGDTMEIKLSDLKVVGTLG
jgi:hypothetical protein